MYETDIAALKLQAARKAATGHGNRLRMARVVCRFMGLIWPFVCRAETKQPGTLTEWGRNHDINFVVLGYFGLGPFLCSLVFPCSNSVMRPADVVLQVA